MDKILETIMNFINENTTLLIIICVFLIFVLIGYLIDNSIKTRKLEKQMINEGPDYNDEPINKEVVAEEVTAEEVVPEKPSIDPNTEINLDFRTPEEIERDNASETIIPEVPAVEPITSTPEIPVEVDPVSVPETPIAPISNEVTVDPAINELLLRDFANNGITEVEEPKIQEVNEEVSINPIENVVSIDSMINSDEPELPSVEPVVPTPEIPAVEEPVVQQEESVYKNDKKLSDIFKKKPVTNEVPNIEKTSDYNTELDKILKKLNEESDSKDSTLGETQDFTNMF